MRSAEMFGGGKEMELDENKNKKKNKQRIIK